MPLELLVCRVGLKPKNMKTGFFIKEKEKREKRKEKRMSQVSIRARDYMVQSFALYGEKEHFNANE